MPPEYTTPCDVESLQAGKDIRYNATEYTTPCDMESLQAGKYIKYNTNPILNVFEFNTAKYKFGDVSTKRAWELCTESRRIYIRRIERNKRLV